MPLPLDGKPAVPRHRLAALLALAAASALVIGACGDGSSESTTEPATTNPNLGAADLGEQAAEVCADHTAEIEDARRRLIELARRAADPDRLAAAAHDLALAVQAQVDDLYLLNPSAEVADKYRKYLAITEDDSQGSTSSGALTEVDGRN